MNLSFDDSASLHKLHLNSKIAISVMNGWQDYQLLDSGRGRKLERLGQITVDRPEPQAMWPQRLDPSVWESADGVFSGEEEADQGRWRIRNLSLETWPVHVMGVTALCRFSAFRHLGVFPEQLPHWQWMQAIIKRRRTDGPFRILNLFGYTGVASLIAAASGAEVTHVDASKKAIEWAKTNQAESGLENAKIRWIIEDARKFAQREVRRGKTYHGILIDPPKFGRGPEGEVWDFFTDIPDLLKTCQSLLDPAQGFVIFTSYAIRASFLSLDTLMKETLNAQDYQYESGELALQEAGENGRLLATSLFCKCFTPNLFG